MTYVSTLFPGEFIRKLFCFLHFQMTREKKIVEVVIHTVNHTHQRQPPQTQKQHVPQQRQRRQQQQQQLLLLLKQNNVLTQQLRNQRDARQLSKELMSTMYMKIVKKLIVAERCSIHRLASS